MNYSAVILADGDFPTHHIPLTVLEKASFLVCCDNAALTLMERTGRVPDAIVGDGDSLPEVFKQKFAGIYHQVDEQDYNDLTKATRFVMSRMQDGMQPLSIAYLGATGKREDHTIGNVSLMNFYRAELGIMPEMITDYGIFTPHTSDTTIDTFPRQQISIFNLTATHMESEGLRWQAGAYRQWWQGTLNEATGQKVTIHADGEYIIYKTHEAKNW